MNKNLPLNLNLNYKKLILIFILVINPFFTLFSQETSYDEITEGKEFWFGLPFCGREQNEAIRGSYPIEIWISSKVDTRATVSDAETNTPVNVNIRKNKITVVPYGDIVMMKESEVAKNFGIHVTADDLVSITVYMSYRWSGEAYRVIPAEWLGTKYVTLNMYQDQLTKSSDYRVPQIMIIASADNTTINYLPTTKTEKGVLAGKVGTAHLNKGQTFLILGSTKPGDSQLESTDMTGTIIESDKPIAVLSGHTKVAFPRYQYTFLGRNGGFMRNMMIEMIPPVDLLGTEYISIPFKYTNRVRGQQTDDAGDLVRFVATEDNTTISQMKKDGSGILKLSPTLKKGQYYDIVNQEQASYYTSTAPVLVGQYGKTWWQHAVTNETKPTIDQGQNPSISGQGMLITLTPNNRWLSYASWRSPDLIDDFINIIFENSNINKLNFDGEKFSTKFGSAIKKIAGTNYAYISESISAGDHIISGDTIPGGKTKATFTAYVYGNWDRSKDGFAYGYPIGMRYNSDCNDSLEVKDSTLCGNIRGYSTAMPNLLNCSSIFNVLLNSSTIQNYEFILDPAFKQGAKIVKWSVNIIDPKKYAFCNIKVLTKSGKSISRTYEYIPEEIKIEPTLVDFGLLKVKELVKGRTLKIINNGKVPMTVKNLKLNNNRPEFEIKLKANDYPFTLQPNQSKVVEVWAKSDTLNILPIREWVIAELSCYDSTIAQLYFNMGEPKVIIDDASWVPQQLDVESSQNVKITNKSDVDVELYSISWPDSDKVNFPKVEGLNFPLILGPHQQMFFKVYYKANTVGIHKTRAYFTANTTKDKLYSDWQASAYSDVNDSKTEIPFISPNPASDYITIPSFSGIIIINNIAGECVFEKNINELNGAYKLDVSGLKPGLYFVVIGTKTYKFLKI